MISQKIILSFALILSFQVYSSYKIDRTYLKQEPGFKCFNNQRMYDDLKRIIVLMRKKGSTGPLRKGLKFF